MQQTAVTIRQQSDREDAELVKRVQRADQRALTALYDRYAPILYPLALRMAGSHEVAEDIILDAFGHVWEKANSYVPQHGSVYAWMTAVCRTRAMEKLRSSNQKRRGQDAETPSSHSLSDDGSKAADPDTVLTLKGYVEEVRNTLKSLSKLELRLLELSFYEGQSQSDLARMLRIPLGTIKAKMRRGIQKLRSAPAQEGKRP